LLFVFPIGLRIGGLFVHDFILSHFWLLLDLKVLYGRQKVFIFGFRFGKRIQVLANSCELGQLL